MSTAKTKMRIFSTIDDVYSALDEGVSIKQEFNFSHTKKTKGKSIKMSLGRIAFNLLLPSDYPLIMEPVNKSKLGQIIKNISDRYEPEIASEVVSTINQEAFKLATYIPTSFSIDALILPQKIKDKKEKLQQEGDNLDPVEYSNEVGKIAEELSQQLEKNDERINDVLVAGIKGDPKIWGSLTISHGYVVDIENNVRGPIKSALTDGYNPKDFYTASAEARRGFFYKSAISSEPGYLSRRVVMASAAIKIDESKVDCGTTKTFQLQVDSNLAKSIVGRYYIDNGKKILIESPSDVVGKTIKLRSPLYCKSEKGICPTCYGELYKKVKNINVGVLAGGVINNSALNTYMKMRHKSSSPVIVKVDFNKDLQKYSIDESKLKKYFTINKNTIIANIECYIEISMDDYTDKTFIESKDYYLLPGIITVKIGENESIEQITFPFNFPVKLMLPANVDKDGVDVVLKYVPGEKIMEQNYYQKETDVSVINRLFEGQAKYISKPEMLVLGLHEQLSSIDLVHLELVVQNMFRDSEVLEKPARLTGYKSYEILGQKKLPFVTNWVNALSFENTKKAIKAGLLTGQDAEDDPITRIVNEKFAGEDD